MLPSALPNLPARKLKLGQLWGVGVGRGQTTGNKTQIDKTRFILPHPHSKNAGNREVRVT